MSATYPTIIHQPWANDTTATADVVFPPDATSATVANQSIGFPPSQEIDPNLGGEYIKRAEMNGVFKLYSQILNFINQGGQFTFDDTVASNGGYDAGVILYAASNNTFQRSLINNNTANFITTPAFLNDGTNWSTAFSCGELTAVGDSTISGTLGVTGAITANSSVTAGGSITTSTGQFHSSHAAYGTELYTPYSSTVAFRCSRDADNRALQLLLTGLGGGGTYGGIGQYDLSGSYWSEIQLDANTRPKISWNGGEGEIAMTSDLTNFVEQSDFTAGSSGTTYFVKLPNGLIIQFGIFTGSNLVFPTQFTQVSTVGVVVTPQTGNSIAQIAAQVTTTSCYVPNGQTTNNFIAIGY